MWKAIKYGTIGAGALLIVGLLLFGTDVFSYVGSSARSIQKSAKDAVPMEFELRRAHDMLEQIIPEMQANVRIIAQEEVEVANLKTDIQQAEVAMATEKTRIQKLGAALDGKLAFVSIGGHDYSREQVKGDLAGRFDRFKEAQQVLDGKKALLAAREKSLLAAIAALEKTRSTRDLLDAKIASLEGQYRLIQAAQTGSQFKVDNSKIAQTEKLIGDIKKRLDVAQRVLAHEAKFVQPIEVDTISEKDLLSEVKDYFEPKTVAKDAEKPADASVAADTPKAPADQQ